MGKLFAKMGSTDHPRGLVLVAYRNARRALILAIRSKSKYNAVFATKEVFWGLKQSLNITALELLDKAMDVGSAQAEAEMKGWGIEPPPPGNPTFFRDSMLDAWVGVVDQQEKEATAALLSTNDNGLITGDNNRLGILRPDSATKSGASWIVRAMMLAYFLRWGVYIEQSDVDWGKQAIPAIDLATTRCCLQVAGQVQPWDGKFELTGTPRFADEMEWTPFHWYCRTTIAMVPMDYADDALTRRIKSDANKLIAIKNKP